MTPERVIKLVELDDTKCDDVDCGICMDCAKLIAAESQREIAAERERVVEECCRAVCRGCREGKEINVVDGEFLHRFCGCSDKNYCPGQVDTCNPIRRLLSKEPPHA